MNPSTLKSKSARKIDLQIKNARAVLRELSETLEDLEDLRAFEMAKKKNAGKPGTPWEIVAKELGIRAPAKKAKRKS
jgi:hypothetical protein